MITCIHYYIQVMALALLPMSLWNELQEANHFLPLVDKFAKCSYRKLSGAVKCSCVYLSLIYNSACIFHRLYTMTASRNEL